MGRVGEFLRGLFGGGGSGAAAADGGIYVRVKCDACGEVIQVRVNPGAELSMADDGQSYFVRKVVVGQQCFRSIEILLTYADLRGKELSREVHGGTSVD
jgi:hypothetical protein